MQRTVASFALATLSLLTAYAISGYWPDGTTPPAPQANATPTTPAPAQTAVVLAPQVARVSD